MIIDLPNTSTSTITKKLVSLRNESGAMTLGRVLTLVIVVDEQRAEEVLESAVEASHMHPCRIVLLVHGNRRAKTRVDGQIRVGGDAGASEVVVLRLYGEVNDQSHALVLPLLLPDSPVVGWWPCTAPVDLATDPVGQLCQRRINDSAVAKNPYAELKRRADHYADGDTDLAWSRITLWRAVIAASLDQRPFEAVTGAVVTGGIDSSATDLLAGWLASQLDVPVTRARTPQGSGLISVRLERTSGPLDLVRPEGTTIATLTHPLQPVRRVSLKRRSDADCLTEELRRLDPDEVYEAALVQGLAKVTKRNALASQLIRAGKAMSPDESRKLARQVGRQSRLTDRGMVSDGEAEGELVPSGQAPHPRTGDRATKQAQIGARVSDDGAGGSDGPATPTVKPAPRAAKTATGGSGNGKGKKRATKGTAEKPATKAATKAAAKKTASSKAAATKASAKATAAKATSTKASS